MIEISNSNSTCGNFKLDLIKLESSLKLKMFTTAHHILNTKFGVDLFTCEDAVQNAAKGVQRGTHRIQSTSASTNGTIRASKNFDPTADCEILRKAMKRVVVNEDEITSVLACRSNRQRQIIKTHYVSMFGKSLTKDLKKNLKGNYRRGILGLIMHPNEYDAFQCNEALTGLGTDGICLIEIFSSRSNADIIALDKEYKEIYKRDLEDEIYGGISGYFRKLLVALLQGQRQEKEKEDETRADQDAQALYMAGESRCWGVDESRFNVILATRGYAQLRLVFESYEKLSKGSIEDAIKNKVAGDLKECMLAIVRCVKNKPGFFAEQLYTSMKGLGTDDRTLIRILISRSEIDLIQIMEEFENKYRKKLIDFIHDDTSGGYRKLLMQMCLGNYRKDKRVVTK